MRSFTEQSRQGSVYLVTLITVAAVVSMVLIGISLRSANSAKSTVIEHLSEQSNGVLDSAELALGKIGTDPTWKLDSLKGTIFDPITLGDKEITSEVIDADTLKTPTSVTSIYRMTLSSTLETARSSAQIDLLADKFDYYGFISSYPERFYWALGESGNPPAALELKQSCDGVYLDPSIAATGVNDEGGFVPVFANSNDHVRVPWCDDMKQADGSISFWMNCTGQNKWTSYGAVGMLYEPTGFPALNISVWGYGINAFVNDNGIYSIFDVAWTPFDTIKPGTWYHVSVTWGAKKLQIYVDGVLTGTNNANNDGVDSKRIGGLKQPLNIGMGYGVSGSSVLPYGFEGSIAHVVYYNRQLDATQVAEIAAVKPDLTNYSLVEDTWVRVFEE